MPDAAGVCVFQASRRRRRPSWQHTGRPDRGNERRGRLTRFKRHYRWRRWAGGGRRAPVRDVIRPAGDVIKKPDVAINTARPVAKPQRVTARSNSAPQSIPFPSKLFSISHCCRSPEFVPHITFHYILFLSDCQSLQNLPQLHCHKKATELLFTCCCLQIASWVIFHINSKNYLSYCLQLKFVILLTASGTWALFL